MTSLLVQTLDFFVLGLVVELEVAKGLLGLGNAGLDLGTATSKKVAFFLSNILGGHLVADLGGPGLKLALLLLDSAAELLRFSLERVADLFELRLFAFERCLELAYFGLFLFDLVSRVGGGCLCL